MNDITLQQPLVSVIIPLYNKASYIKRALDSVLTQTVQDFEIIVVGGNSTDSGENIVLSYSDSRIRFVKEAGKGVSAARNQGVDAARAELVAFLDADDEWLPEFLETILRLREKWPEAGMYSTAWVNDYPDGCQYSSKCYGIGTGFEGIVQSVFRCAAMDGVFPGYTSSIVVPKDVFLRVGGFRADSCMGEDLDLWGRIALDYSNAHCSNPHVCYHHDDEMAATKNPSLILFEEYPFQRSIREMISSGKIMEEKLGGDLRLYLESINIGLAYGRISRGEKALARNLLKNVTLPELRLKKYVAYIRTLLPEFIMPGIRQLLKIITKKLWC